MKTERPVLIQVVGTMNLGVGVLSLLCSSCAGIGHLDLISGGMGADQVEAMRRAEEAALPGYHFIKVGYVVLTLVLPLLLILSGVGLLSMKKWGKQTGILYSVATILCHVAFLIVRMAFINPAMAVWAQNQGAVPGTVAGMATEGVLSSLIGVLYPLALLVVMFLPAFSQAWAGNEQQTSPTTPD